MGMETVKEAKSIISNHLVTGDMLNIDEMLSWFAACRNDNGERSWWLTLGLLDVFKAIAMGTDSGFSEVGFDRFIPSVGRLFTGKRVRMDMAIAAAPYGNYHDKAYIETLVGGRRFEVEWVGPLSLASASALDWPTELYPKRNEVELAIVDNQFTWVHHNRLGAMSTRMHTRGFYPTANLNGISYNDKMSISKIIWKYMPSFSNRELVARDPSKRM